MIEKPYTGLRIIVSICLMLATLGAVVAAVLGFVFELETWMVITLIVFAVLGLALWIWFFCVSAKLAANGRKSQENE